jgi:hypothetical protein
MIKRLVPFFIGVLLGAALMYVGLLYHVVRASDGFHLITKTKATLSGSYADIREYDLQDWNEHPDLTIAISASGKANLLTESAVDNIQKAGQDLWDDFRN